jgi:hypothetical protein
VEWTGRVEFCAGKGRVEDVASRVVDGVVEAALEETPVVETLLDNGTPVPEGKTVVVEF